VLIGPGQANDSPMFPCCSPTSARNGPAADGPGPRPTPCWAIRPTPPGRTGRCCARAASRPSSPNRRTRPATAAAAAPAGGRPPAFDADTYRGRNVIERSFNTLKQWRGLATRYDKLAIVYRGAAVLRAVTIWLKHL
jgi:transposase